MSGQLLTARTVAERLGVSTETVLRWIRRRKLPAIRLPGGAIRIREDELERWLDERTTLPAGVDRRRVAAAETGVMTMLSSHPTDDVNGGR